jgi:LPS-assembly lipoprotein
MWWSERRRPTTLIVAALALTLAGCLRPMYGPLGNGPSVSTALAAVSVDEVRGRLGHYLNEELSFALNGGAAPVETRYRLAVSLNERIETPVADVVTGRAQVATIIVDAEYILTRAGGGPEVTRGRAVQSASYTRLNQRFAGVRAGRDAEIRISRLLAEQIKNRIAAVLATKGV